jgi:hypothetical protein
MTRAFLSEGTLWCQIHTQLFYLHKSSLPTNMDQAELSRLLSDHLREHTEVKYVKVIRDSKGGVCAFVQCEVAFSIL